MCLEPFRAGLDLSFMCIGLLCRAKLLVVRLFHHHAQLRLDNVRACSGEPWWQLRKQAHDGFRTDHSVGCRESGSNDVRR